MDVNNSLVDMEEKETIITIPVYVDIIRCSNGHPLAILPVGSKLYEIQECPFCSTRIVKVEMMEKVLARIELKKAGNIFHLKQILFVSETQRIF